jgi:cellulose synthase/poly-beta-1,6-N-acetylglucosamine synthase-like glycosyltransferase
MYLPSPSPWLSAYVLFGPLAWLIVGAGMYFGRRRMIRLEQLFQSVRLPEHPPLVSVLIPAKDEGPSIRECMDSVLAQDYPRLEVIAVNDRSTDDTGRVLDDLAAGSAGRVQVIHIPADGLPSGWLGKCHALHVGTQRAAGEWLLFVDSDVRLEEPHLLTAALSVAVARRYDAVSLLTRLECHGFLERLVLPIAAGAWLNMNHVSFTNEDRFRRVAFANGQFLLARRNAYDAVGGHAAVKDRITEDVELYRALKLSGYRPRLLIGNRYVSTRMHANLGQMMRGWSRIYSGTARRRPWRILATLLFILVCGFSVYAAIIAGGVALASGASGGAAWVACGLVHFAVMTGVLGWIYNGTGNPPVLSLLFPLSGSVVIALLLAALRACVTGRIVWRGTVFDQRSQPKA